jgi:hypothetical protein
MKVQRQVMITPQDGPAYYWSILRPWLRVIAVAALLAASLTLAVTKFLLTHYYQAVAVIRPVSKVDQGNLMSGMLAGVAGSIGSFAALSSDEEKEADRFTSILTSYAFTMQLMKRDNLATGLIAHSLTHRLLGRPISQYGLYRKMTGLFAANFNLKTGNVNLTFLDPDRTRAEKVLGDYIDMLRGRLREHEIGSATAAIDSLQKEAGATSDAQLQANLYDSIAKQIERRSLAQVQADFSFELIDPPVAPDGIHKPKEGLDCVLAALLTAFLGALIIIASDSLSAETAQSRLSEVVATPASSAVEEEPTPHRLKRQG